MSTQHTIKQLRDQLFDLSAEVAALAKTNKWTKQMYIEAISGWESEKTKRSMAAQLQAHRAGYLPTKAYSGKSSLHNGDPVANFLSGKTPDEAMADAERLCGLKAGELKAKYEHLNIGQQRMNAGNRIRGAIKRGELLESELV